MKNQITFFSVVKFVRKDGKDIEGSMREKDGTLGFSEKDRKRIWKNYVEQIVNKESDWTT